MSSEKFAKDPTKDIFLYVLTSLFFKYLSLYFILAFSVLLRGNSVNAVSRTY